MVTMRGPTLQASLESYQKPYQTTASTHMFKQTFSSNTKRAFAFELPTLATDWI
jgi:hypothetical protein